MLAAANPDTTNDTTHTIKSAREFPAETGKESEATIAPSLLAY